MATGARRTAAAPETARATDPAAPGAGSAAATAGFADPADLAAGFSIEVMPRTAARIADFRTLLPDSTRVYLAHIPGTEIRDMVATAARLTREGFAVMVHIPARAVADEKRLASWVRAYREEAGIEEALLLGGGGAPEGCFETATQLLETGQFADFARIHFAGHPEGNPAAKLDATGLTQALLRKIAILRAQSAVSRIAVTTQFVFDARPVIDWAAALRAADVEAEIHVGVAGPAKPATLLKYAADCGVGASIGVLRRQLGALGALMRPWTPDAIAQDLAAHRAAVPTTRIAGLHLFPLGGIARAADWARAAAGTAPARAG